MLELTSPILLLGLFLLMQTTPVFSAPMVYKCKSAQAQVYYQKSPCHAAQTVGEWTTLTQPIIEKQTPLIILQSADGHYHLNARVNNSEVNFIIDTGASVVALPNSLAVARTLSCRGYAQMNTANGLAKVCVTQLAKLQLGLFHFENINAVIMPNLSQPLLGMNVLEKFTLEQKQGELRLLRRSE